MSNNIDIDYSITYSKSKELIELVNGSGKTLVKNIDGIIDSLKEDWKSNSGVKHIQTLERGHNAIANYFNSLATLGSACSEAAAMVENYDKAGAGESGTLKKIAYEDKIQYVDNLFSASYESGVMVTEKAQEAKDKLNKTITDLKDFKDKAKAIYQVILQYWKAGANRETLSNGITQWETNLVETIIPSYEEIVKYLNIAISNYKAGHKIKSYGKLHSDAKALEAKVQSELDGAILKEFGGAIEHLKEVWKGRDAGERINSLTIAYNSIVNYRNTLSKFASAAADAAIVYDQLEQDNAVGAENVGLNLQKLASSTASQKEEYIDTTDTVDIQQSAQNDADAINRVKGAYGNLETEGTFSYVTYNMVSADSSQESMLKNWTEGAGRSELENEFKNTQRVADWIVQILETNATVIGNMVKIYDLEANTEGHRVANISNLYTEAKTLEANVGSADTYIQNIKTIIYNLSKCWFGETAKSYIPKLINTGNFIIKLRNDLSKLAIASNDAAYSYDSWRRANAHEEAPSKPNISFDTISTIDPYTDNTTGSTKTDNEELKTQRDSLTLFKNNIESLNGLLQTDFTNIKGNWTTGPGREELVSAISGFEKSFASYIKQVEAAISEMNKDIEYYETINAGQTTKA